MKNQIHFKEYKKKLENEKFINSIHIFEFKQKL